MNAPSIYIYRPHIAKENGEMSQNRYYGAEVVS